MQKCTVLWLSGVTCNGNTHAFLNHEGLIHFLKHFTFIYHPVIDSAYTLEEVVSGYIPCDIVLIEGSISQECQRAGVSLHSIIRRYAKDARAVVTVGTCASFGGVFSELDPLVGGLHFRKKEPLDFFKEFKHKSISLSGCPVHPQIIATTLYAIKEKMQIATDAFLRPKAYYAYTIHNGCTRNEYFEYKIDDHRFGKLEGCMFYDHGCQAPFTHGSCNKILWNGESSKTRAGMPCVGCTEADFPKLNLFSTKKHMGIPSNLPLGVPKRAYISLAGIAKAFKIERLEKGLLDD